MKEIESAGSGVYRLVAAALTLWLLEVLCTGACPATAQSASFAWLSVGGETYQTTVLKALSPADTNPVSSGLATAVGLSGGIFLDRLFLGGSADATLPRSTRENGTEMRVTGGSGRIRVGYGLLLRDRFMLYPTAGIGIGGTEVRLDGMGGESGVVVTSKVHSTFGVVTFQLNGDLVKGLHPKSGPGVGWSLGVKHTFGHGDGRVRNGSGFGGRSVPIEADRTVLGIALRLGWGVTAFRR